MDYLGIAGCPWARFIIQSGMELFCCLFERLSVGEAT